MGKKSDVTEENHPPVINTASIDGGLSSTGFS
jgi:hypothetical protein